MAIEETIVKSAISGGVATLSTVCPPLDTLLSILQPVAEDFASRALSAYERNRVDRTYAEIINKIKQKLDSGLFPRDDDYWAPKYEGISDANILLEGVLTKARDEYEEKKRRYYPNLCANMCFTEHLPYERLNTILKLFEQLTYRQLQILAYVNQRGKIETAKWDTHLKVVEEAYKYFDIYYDVFNLYNINLLRQPRQGWSASTNDLDLSPLGKDLVVLTELYNMPDEEINEISSYIDAINGILASH